MNEGFDGDWVIFRIDNSGIKLQMPDGSVTEDITKMGDFDAVLNSMERSLRSASGNTEFRFNTGLRYSDIKTGYQYQDVAVKREAYKTLLNVLRGWEAKKQLGSYGAEGQEITNSYLTNAEPEEAKILKYVRTIQGRQARTKMKKEALLAGGFAEETFTEKNTERMTAYIPVRQSEYEKLVEKYKDSKNPEKAARQEIYDNIFKETTAKQESEKTLRKQAEKIQEEKQLEREEKTQEKEAEKETKESRKRIHSVMTAIIASVVLIADILRRILSAVMQNAVQTAKDRVDADNTGAGLLVTRENRILDKSKGLQEGTHAGAISSLQSKFGDITKIDTNSLGILARVMGNDVVDFVESGMGGKATPMLLENILNKFFEQFKSGKNSLGVDVGQGAARRELVTVLSEISPELASIFAKMADDYMNGVSFSNYSDWRNTVNLNRTSLLGFEQDYNAQLGNRLNEIIAAVEDLKNSFLTRLLNSMGGWIETINNWRIGMSAEENMKTDLTNRQKNFKSYESLLYREELYEDLIEPEVTSVVEKQLKRIGKNPADYNFTVDELVQIMNGTYEKQEGEKRDKVKLGEDLAKIIVGSKDIGEVFLKLAAVQKLKKTLEEENIKRSGEKINEISVTEDRINVEAQEALESLYDGKIKNFYNDMFLFDSTAKLPYKRLPITERLQTNFRLALNEAYKNEEGNPVERMRSVLFDTDKDRLLRYSRDENGKIKEMSKKAVNLYGDRASNYYYEDGSHVSYKTERDRRIKAQEKKLGRNLTENEIRSIELDIMSESFWLDEYAGLGGYIDGYFGDVTPSKNGYVISSSGFLNGIEDRKTFMQNHIASATVDAMKNELDKGASNILGNLATMLVDQNVPYGSYNVTGTPDPYNRGQFTLRIEGNVNGKNIEKEYTYSGEQAGAINGVLEFDENSVNFTAK